MYSKWYIFKGISYTSYIWLFSSKRNYGLEHVYFFLFSIKQSYRETAPMFPRFLFALFSFTTRALHMYYVLSRIWDTCDVPRRFRHSIDTPHDSPNTRSSNLNNWVIDFRALVRRVYLNTISDLDSLVRPHFRWIVYDSIHSVLEYDNYKIQILYLLYKYYPFYLFFYILVPIS